ncbi:MAG: hypothetical protein ACM33T_15645 [Solirubrobacterales bacterium]
MKRHALPVLTMLLIGGAAVAQTVSTTPVDPAPAPSGAEANPSTSPVPTTDPATGGTVVVVTPAPTTDPVVTPIPTQPRPGALGVLDRNLEKNPDNRGLQNAISRIERNQERQEARPERVERAERADKVEKVDRVDRPARPERIERPERPERAHGRG